MTQQVHNWPKSAGPSRSKCGNRRMPCRLIGFRLVFACEHNLIYGATLTAAGRAAYLEANAPRRTA